MMKKSLMVITESFNQLEIEQSIFAVTVLTILTLMLKILETIELYE